CPRCPAPSRPDRSAPIDRGQCDRFRDALEPDLPSVDSGEAPGGRLQRGVAHEDLAVVGERADARGEVHTGAGVVAAAAHAAGRVDPDPDLWREPMLAAVPCERALDGTRRVEGAV